ncbi:hypothetical protein [Rhodopila sp.]|uniref:hypothetical protein n=1 Tax=Rhodopila sp. TaxID=2480087 RepID=UPI003D127D5B
MSSQSVTLGQVVLQDFEVPNSIQFGGQQKLVVHRLSGGARAIELLGPDDSEIRFHGIFSGPSAESRARSLDSLRLSGATVSLSWQSYEYQVIVRSFSADYRNRWWIGYQIGCVVVNQAGLTSSGTGSLQALITADLSVALSALNDQPVALSDLSAAVGAAGALTVGTTANAQAYVTAANTLNLIDSQTTTQSQVLTSPNQSYTSVADATSLYNDQVANAASLAFLANARAYVGRICTSLGSLAS